MLVAFLVIVLLGWIAVGEFSHPLVAVACRRLGLGNNSVPCTDWTIAPTIYAVLCCVLLLTACLQEQLRSHRIVTSLTGFRVIAVLLVRNSPAVVFRLHCWSFRFQLHECYTVGVRSSDAGGAGMHRQHVRRGLQHRHFVIAAGSVR